MLEWLANPLVRELIQTLPIPGVLLLIAFAFKRQIAAAVDTHIKIVATVPELTEAIASIRDMLGMMATALGRLHDNTRKDVVLVVEDELSDQRLIEETLRESCESRGLTLKVVPSFKFARDDLMRVRIVIMDLCTPGCHEIESVVALLYALHCRSIVVFTGREGVKSIPGTTLLKKGDNDAWEKLRKYVEEHSV